VPVLITDSTSPYSSVKMQDHHQRHAHAYMAPSICAGREVLRAQAIYSLALILRECLADKDLDHAWWIGDSPACPRRRPEASPAIGDLLFAMSLPRRPVGARDRRGRDAMPHLAPAASERRPRHARGVICLALTFAV